MSKFISIPGQQYSGKRNVGLPRHPNADSYYQAREATSHEATGFEPGEEVYFKGEPAKVLGERKEGGEVVTYFQVSRRGDAAVYKAKWAPDKARSLVIRDARRAIW